MSSKTKSLLWLETEEDIYQDFSHEKFFLSRKLKMLPLLGTTSTHIQSICDAMEIPHIESRWDFVQRKEDYSINLYPNPKTISRVNILQVKVNRNAFVVMIVPTNF